MTDIDLRGLVVAISGGAQGIGKEIATQLIAAGANVGIGDLDHDLARQTADGLGLRAAAFPLDVTDLDQFRTFLDGVEESFGPIDVLVNNAGIMIVGDFVKESQAVTDAQINVNIHGVINGCRAVLPRFRDRNGGHIVNIASMAGRVAPALLVTYSATKHAVLGLTEGLRNEYRGTGIQVSAVMPNAVNTRLGAGLARNITKPLEASDVAEVVLHVIRTRANEASVPRWLGPMSEATRPLGSRARTFIERMTGRDRTFSKGQLDRRAEYERDAIG